jgi:beta-glucosidase
LEWHSITHAIVNARDPASKPIILDGAIEGHVLVKNANASLPLKSPKLLSIFGYDAVAPPGMDIGTPENFFAPFTLGFESELDCTGFVTPGLLQLSSQMVH